MVVLYFSIDSVIWLLKVFKNNLGDIFQLGDAVKSWNPWSLLWVRGYYPITYYGQLIPINYSITYIFMQNSQIQFFAAGFMPLFAIFVLLTFIDLSLEYKNVGFLLALVFTRYMMKKFAGGVIDDGYVDIAIMFFYFLPIHALLKAYYSSDLNNKFNYLILGGFFSAAAAVTKQSGLSILVAYPILAYLVVIRTLPRIDQKRWIVKLAISFLVALAIVLPLYIINTINPLGLKRAVLGVSQLPIYKEAILSRAWNAILTIQKYNVLYILIIISMPFSERIYRWLTTAIIFPYSIIWAIFLSYDTRNFTPVIPILALTAGIGFMVILSKIEKGFQLVRLSKMRSIIIILFLMLCVVFISQKYPDDLLINRQVELEKDLFFPQLNDLVYSKLSELGPDARIIFHDYPLDVLPGLFDSIAWNRFDSPEELATVLEMNPEIRLILVSKSSNPAITNYIFERLETRRLILVAEMGIYIFVEVPVR
jgi:hypothetical protein